MKYETNPSGPGDNAYIDNIVFSPTPPSGITEAHPVFDFDIYPNPGKDKFTLIYNSPRTEMITIQLSDICGRILSGMNKNINTGTNNITIDAVDLSPGIYNCILKAGDAVMTKKLVSLQ